MKSFRHVLQVARRFGLAAAVAWIVDRLASRLFNLDLNRMFWLELDQLAVVEPPPHLTCRFLSAQEVRALAADEANDLEASMADRIERGRDFCFAVLDQGALAAYGWYAIGSIEAEHSPGPAMALPEDVVYMYKAFTLPAYRGRRLASIGKRLALQALAERGVRKLLAIVHWTNWPSLRSFRHLGCAGLGCLFTVGPPCCSLVHVPRKAVARGIVFNR